MLKRKGKGKRRERRALGFLLYASKPEVAV